MSNTEKQKQQKHDWYLRNKELTYQRSKLGRRNRRGLTKKFFDTLRERHPCSICKESNYYCLDFHHMDSTEKEHTISNLKSKDYFGKILFNEISKCCIICKNCHSKLHANQLSKKDLTKLKLISLEELYEIKEFCKQWKVNQSGTGIVLKTIGT